MNRLSWISILAIAVIAAATACRSDTPPATSTTTAAASSAQSSPAPPPPTSEPVTPTDQTIFEYLDKHGITMEWQTQQGLTDLKIAETAPAKWKQTESEDIPSAYAIWARAGLPDGQYIPRALVIVGKLSAPVDPKEAIQYGFVDTEQLSGWKRNKASLDDFQGFPSSTIEGTYMDSGVELAISNRYVIATVGEAQYFVQFTINMALSQAQEFTSDAKALQQGFTIKAQ